MPECGGQGVQSLRDLRGGCGMQGLFDVTHNLLGTCWPVTSLWARVFLAWALHGQAQDVHQELSSC